MNANEIKAVLFPPLSFLVVSSYLPLTWLILGFLSLLFRSRRPCFLFSRFNRLAKEESGALPPLPMLPILSTPLSTAVEWYIHVRTYTASTLKRGKQLRRGDAHFSSAGSNDYRYRVSCISHQIQKPKTTGLFHLFSFSVLSIFSDLFIITWFFFLRIVLARLVQKNRKARKSPTNPLRWPSRQLPALFTLHVIV